MNCIAMRRGDYRGLGVIYPEEVGMRWVENVAVVIGVVLVEGTVGPV